jgi:hypothetical protein
VIKLYYARSSYLLTFVLNNGEDPVKQVLPYLSAVTAPAELKKDGYVFSGWDRPLAASILNEDLTYTAQWVARTDTAYTVKHVRQNLDDTYPATGSLVEQETLTAPPCMRQKPQANLIRVSRQKRLPRARLLPTGPLS